MKTRQFPFDELLMRCGCLELVDAIGFQSSGIHHLILNHATSEELFRYAELLRQYIYADICHRLKFNGPII